MTEYGLLRAIRSFQEEILKEGYPLDQVVEIVVRPALFKGLLAQNFEFTMGLAKLNITATEAEILGLHIRAEAIER